VAWERKVRIAAPCGRAPALLTCHWNLNQHCLQRKLHITLTLLHRIQLCAQPAIFVLTQDMLHKLHPISRSAAVKNDDKCLFACTSTYTDIIKHQLEVYSTHALIPNHAHAAPT